MGLKPDQAPLNKEDQELFEKLRPLSVYKLHYQNPRYPLLAFIYAVYAGGEHALYCDYTRAYVEEYLKKSDRPQTMQEVGAILQRVARQRDIEREKDPKDQQLIVCTPEEWDRIWAVLKAELLQDPPPLPMW